MKTIAKLAVAGALLVGMGTAAYADCNHDTGSETVLGAGAGAAVGGLASHSIGGAVIGGVGGALIGNAIGQSNNRADCRAEAREYYREREEAYNDGYVEPARPPDGYVGHDGYVHDYPDD
ncbi:MAG TPA: glycine zipper domain-containing protein [Rhizomicrobium sp.]|nr:glycine zipper domain-containing protein [Rhizomicrobium sp.]